MTVIEAAISHRPGRCCDGRGAVTGNGTDGLAEVRRAGVNHQLAVGPAFRRTFISCARERHCDLNTGLGFIDIILIVTFIGRADTYRFGTTG
jgi:hypothetical protein